MKARTLSLTILCLLLSAVSSPGQNQKGHVWDGSRSVPVHLLSLRDEFDQIIKEGPLFMNLVKAFCRIPDKSGHFHADNRKARFNDHGDNLADQLFFNTIGL